MRIRPADDQGSASARSSARKWRIRRCAFALPENGESAGERSPARKWRIRGCALARPKMEDPQERVRPPENVGSAGARLPA